MVKENSLHRLYNHTRLIVGSTYSKVAYLALAKETANPALNPTAVTGVGLVPRS